MQDPLSGSWFKETNLKYLCRTFETMDIWTFTRYFISLALIFFLELIFLYTCDDGIVVMLSKSLYLSDRNWNIYVKKQSL